MTLASNLEARIASHDLQLGFNVILTNVSHQKCGTAVLNTAPVAFPDAYSMRHDTVLTVTTGGLLANDFDLESDPLSIVLVTPPAHGVLDLNPDGSFTYTPHAHFVGQETFTYKLNDGAADSRPAKSLG